MASPELQRLFLNMPIFGGQLSSSVTQKVVEIDVGSLPVYDATILVTDPAVLTTSNVAVTVSGIAPTGKDVDDVYMDSFDVKATPSSGSFQVYIRGLEGYIHDKFKIIYSVGN